MTDEAVEAARQRAKRAQDGMTVNREAMYREHEQLAGEVQRWRGAFNRAKRESGDKAPAGDFTSRFDDIFNDVFGKKS